MSIFHQCDDSQLQGVPAVPVPHDGAGPTHTSIITLEPYYREAEEDVPCLYAGSGYDSNSERQGI